MSNRYGDGTFFHSSFLVHLIFCEYMLSSHECKNADKKGPINISAENVGLLYNITSVSCSGPVQLPPVGFFVICLYRWIKGKI